MKKTAPIMLVLAIAVIGCNQSDPVSSDTAPSPTVASPSGLVQTTTQNSPIAPPANKKVEQFNADIKRLADLAQESEAIHDYVSAAKIWGQMRQLMSDRLGPRSWQTKNAELAYEIAYAKSKFSAEQMRTWKQVENLQMSVQQSLQSGDVQSAYTATRQLSQLKKQLFGGESFLYGQSLVQLATMDAQVGQFDIAIGNLNDSMAIMKAHGLNDHPERMAVHASLANMFLQVSKLKTAVANQKEATRIAGVVFGVQSLQMATQANQLAAIFHRAGNLPVAEDVFRRSLAIRENLLGPDHLAVAHSCLNLGVVLMDAKNLNEAQQSLERASQIFAKETGIDSAVSQRCQSKLAVVAMLEQRPDRAEKILKGIIHTLARTQRPDSDELLTYQYRLSIALGRQGKYSEAGPLMQSVLDFQQHKYGDADSRTVATMQAYAMLLDRTKNEKSAAQIRNRIQQVSHVVDDNDFQRR